MKKRPSLPVLLLAAFLVAWLVFLPRDFVDQVRGSAFGAAFGYLVSWAIESNKRRAVAEAQRAAGRIPSGFGIGGRNEKPITREWVVRALSEEPNPFEVERFVERLVRE